MRRRLWLLAVLGVVAGCGPCSEKEEPALVAPTPTPTAAAPVATPTATPSPSPSPTSAPGIELAVGLTEQNPNLWWPEQVHEVPPEFQRWRADVGALRPSYLRLVVDWSVIEREQGNPKFDDYTVGCMREKPPCGPYLGLKDQLAALAARQKEGGSEVLVVLTGTPEWAARPPGGCEREGTVPRSRPPTAAGMKAYGRFAEQVLALAREQGANLRYWSPANEPNHPFFVSPQRRVCQKRAPSAAVPAYVEMARTLKDVLDKAPGDQELVLGELAGLDKRRPMTTSIREFIDDLPKDLVCPLNVWSQHGYVGGRDPVDDVWLGLRRKGCGRMPTIWITETGVGAPRAGEQRRTSVQAQVKACGGLHRRLLHWYRDARVTAAFQYTFREDDLFPTGLIKTDLSEAYPALGEWTAWGGTRTPNDPPPKNSCSSQGT